MNKTIHITFIIGSMQGGGAERVISILSDRFINEGYKVSLVILRRAPINYEINEKVKIIELLDVNSTLKRFFLSPSKLAKIMIELQSDLFVSFCILENIISILANLSAKQKLIISERNSPEAEKTNPILKILRKMLYYQANGYVFQTKAAQSYYSESIQNRSIIIPNPISMDLPTCQNIARDKSVVAVGRLAEQKNYPLLIQAFSEFNKKFPEYNLIIYGQGVLLDELISIVKKENLENKVIFNGFCSNVHERIVNSSFYVMTSDFEGMPNALMEAMAMGIPVISTDCPSGGPKELIQNYHNGILISVNSKKELVDAMILLASDPLLCSKLSENAKMVREKYNIDIIFPKWETYINELIKVRIR